MMLPDVFGPYLKSIESDKNICKNYSRRKKIKSKILTWMKMLGMWIWLIWCIPFRIRQQIERLVNLAQLIWRIESNRLHGRSILKWNVNEIRGKTTMFNKRIEMVPFANKKHKFFSYAHYYLDHGHADWPFGFADGTYAAHLTLNIYRNHDLAQCLCKSPNGSWADRIANNFLAFVVRIDSCM